MFVRLRPGDDVAGFEADVKRVPGTASVLFFNSERDQTASVQRSIHVQAVALWLLAALVGVSGLLVLAQTLARQALLESSDYPTLRALGMTHAQLWAVGMVRAGVVAGLGAVVAVGLAILASPLSPVGTARIVESTPGFSLDARALVVGAVGIVMLVLVVAAFPTWRAAGVTAGVAGPAGQVRHSVVAEGLARASAPLPAVLGVRLALEPGRGRSAVPVRSTVLAGVLAIATVTMAVTFGASVAHLSDTPRLYGWNWDAQIGSIGAPDISAPLIEGLRANPAVASFSAGTITALDINGVPVDAYAQDQVQGSAPPALLSGRAPARPDEIVVGTRTLRAARAHVGQTVTVRIGARTLPMRVVGRAVFPSFGESGQLGKGAQLSYQTLKRLTPGSAPPRNIALVRFAPASIVGPHSPSSTPRSPGIPSTPTSNPPTWPASVGSTPCPPCSPRSWRSWPPPPSPTPSSPRSDAGDTTSPSSKPSASPPNKSVGSSPGKPPPSALSPSSSDCRSGSPPDAGPGPCSPTSSASPPNPPYPPSRSSSPSPPPSSWPTSSPPPPPGPPDAPDPPSCSAPSSRRRSPGRQAGCLPPPGSGASRTAKMPGRTLGDGASRP